MTALSARLKDQRTETEYHVSPGDPEKNKDFPMFRGRPWVNIVVLDGGTKMKCLGRIVSLRAAETAFAFHQVPRHQQDYLMKEMKKLGIAWMIDGDETFFIETFLVD